MPKITKDAVKPTPAVGNKAEVKTEKSYVILLFWLVLLDVVNLLLLE